MLFFGMNQLKHPARIGSPGLSRVSEEKGDQWRQSLALLDDVCLDTWRKNLLWLGHGY